jgi:DNA polymerase-3 subunit alpha
MSNSNQQYAIRFGLSAIKAVGLKAMQDVAKERELNGNFRDIYDFARRIDPKSINKKSIEALAKSGSFDDFDKNRNKFFESFEIISSYSSKKKIESESSQMSLFSSIATEETPELKKSKNWTREEKLQKEFEAFGFFLNEHPLDEKVDDLRKRQIIFSDKIDELEDGSLVKMAGIITSSKHKSSSRGRFAYFYISDPFGIFEATIFDEALITSSRDILFDGSKVSVECLIKKDDGGSRILVRSVKKLEDFIRTSADKMDERRDDKKLCGNNMKNINPVVPKENAANIPELKIKIKSREEFYKIKSILLRSIDNKGSKEQKKIFLIVEENEKSIRIELPNLYFIDDVKCDA